MEAITQVQELELRYCNLVFIGLLYLKIMLNLLNIMMNSKELQVILVRNKKFLYFSMASLLKPLPFWWSSMRREGDRVKGARKRGSSCPPYIGEGKPPRGGRPLHVCPTSPLIMWVEAPLTSTQAPFK
jgi:hypothetical protein